MTAPTCAASGRGAANATEPLTAWFSTTGADCVDCINGPEPNGERGGGGALDAEVDERGVCGLDEAARPGAGVVRGADDPPLRTGVPLATPLSNSSSGSSL